MPLKPNAEKYRGRSRSKQQTIDRLRGSKTAPVAGVWPDDPVAALAEWCAATLTVPPGHPLAGEPMTLPDYVAGFLADALADGVFEALLCVARKNGKTAGVALLILGLLAGPLKLAGLKVGTVSITKEKAGELLAQCRAISDASGLTGIEFLRTPSPGLIRNDVGGLAEFLSADKSAGHASGFDLAVVDELGLMTERDRDLIAGMRSATSAKQGRLLAMSIRGESPMLEELIERRELPTAVVHLYAPDVAATGAVDIHDPAVWAAGNPGIATGIKSAEYMAAEAARVTATPTDLATFLAFDLNLPQSPTRETICSVADLSACYVDELPPRAGPCYIGLDLGGAAALTGAFAIWPSTGRCEGWLGCGSVPDVITRGRRDGARYDLMVERSELRTYDGRVTPVDRFIADVAADLDGQPVAGIAGDSYKDAECKDALQRAGVRWPYEFRRVGSGKQGSADVRAFQRLILNSKLRLRESLALASAVGNSAIRRDGNGNPALDKANAKGRIDLLSAAIIAAGLSEYEFDRVRKPRARYRGKV